MVTEYSEDSQQKYNFIDEKTGYKCFIVRKNKYTIRCGVQAPEGHPMNTGVCSWYLVDHDNIQYADIYKAMETCKKLANEIYKFDICHEEK